MLEKFEAHIAQWNWKEKNTPLLVASSGGVDSTVLTHLCDKANLNFAIAHCNFQLRGSESDDDEAFVRNLADGLHRKAYIKTFDTKKIRNENGGSIQMVARDLRYHWFKEILEKEDFEYVLTAHHLNDSLETFLINLSRGTGIFGLTGIPEINENICRPLLPFSREEILNYAKENKIHWREDKSNIENKYLRNKIRHEVIPKLKEFQPQFLQNFEKTLYHLRGTSSLLEKYQKTLKSELFQSHENFVHINIENLKKHRPDKNLLYFLFSEYGFTQWNDLLRLLDAKSGKEIQSGSHRLLKDRNELLLKKISAQDREKFFKVDENDTKIERPIRLQFKGVESIENCGPETIFVDKDKLSYPLTLKKPNEGEWFIPFGMKGKKKVSKLLKDLKINNFTKESIWLLCSGHDVVWVVGLRSDSRFAVSKTTKKILKIKFG